MTSLHEQLQLDEILQLFPWKNRRRHLNSSEFRHFRAPGRKLHARSNTFNCVCLRYHVDPRHPYITLTLDTQHFRLLAGTMRGRYNYEVLPLDYASQLVHKGQLSQAIETLEQGRALL